MVGFVRSGHKFYLIENQEQWAEAAREGYTELRPIKKLATDYRKHGTQWAFVNNWDVSKKPLVEPLTTKRQALDYIQDFIEQAEKTQAK